MSFHANDRATKNGNANHDIQTVLDQAANAIDIATTGQEWNHGIRITADRIHEVEHTLNFYGLDTTEAPKRLKIALRANHKISARLDNGQIDELIQDALAYNNDKAKPQNNGLDLDTYTLNDNPFGQPQSTRQSGKNARNGVTHNDPQATPQPPPPHNQANFEKILGESNAAKLMMTAPEPRGWLLGNQFCRKFLSSVIAAGAVGKTSLRIVQFLSLATGRNLIGQHVFKRSRVLLIGLEDDIDELKRRLAAAMIHYGILPEDLDRWLYVIAPIRAIQKIDAAVQNISVA
jgi:hypothetical protein